MNITSACMMSRLRALVSAAAAKPSLLLQGTSRHLVGCPSICTSHPVERSIGCGSLRLDENSLRRCLHKHSSIVFVPCRLMAGHSKWSNIKHIKAAKDGEKARAAIGLTNKIVALIKTTGVADPKASLELARLVALAKTKNIPSATVDAAIDRAKRALESTSLAYFEGRGPGGSYFILEVCTDKPKRSHGNIQSSIKKYGAQLQDNAAKHAFDKKGVLDASLGEEAENVDLEKYVDIAIEAGAEDVAIETDESEEKFLRFVCEPDDLFKVKKELEQREILLTSVGMDFISTLPVVPKPLDMELVTKMMEKFERNEEIVRVFINVEAPDS